MLVNDTDDAVGTMEKMEAHRQGLLHRAFSVFIFNGEGEMLLQKRSLEKYHSAGLWTNACCSHPFPGETTSVAAERRLHEELGFKTRLVKIFDFKYKTSFGNGLIEHEFDHVFVGRYDGHVIPNEQEVFCVEYRSLDYISMLMNDAPDSFTSWFHIAFPRVRDWAKSSGIERVTFAAKNDELS